MYFDSMFSQLRPYTENFSRKIFSGSCPHTDTKEIMVSKENSYCGAYESIAGEL